MSTVETDLQPAFTFIDRITSEQKMGVSSQGGKTVLTPSSIQGGTYQSPYRLAFDYSWAGLTAGLAQAPFNDWTQEGNPEYFHEVPQDWFNPEIYQSNSGKWQVGSVSWGPGPQLYLPPVIPPDAESNIVAWQTQRLLAVAASMIGYGYRHHHIPDWNPGPTWYDGVPSAQPPDLPDLIGQGVDCSDYTSWLYNYGLGIYLNTDVATQGVTKTVTSNDNKTTYTVQRVADATASYDELVQQLQTGDLLYIAGAANLSKLDIQQDLKNGTPPQITHVIMWLGDVGVSSGGTPLVTDSHGDELIDENGKTIPGGIQVRPFNQGSDSGSDSSVPVGESAQNWYFEHFLWALRILPDL